jgi:tetratricopeptide (TPR) repeat protein
VRIAPRLASPRVALASALYDRGEIDRAIRHYRRALEIDPELAVAHGNLGVALRERGELEVAHGHLSRALQLAPDIGVAQIHGNLGLLLKLQGDAEGALHHYRAALRLDPDYSEAHAHLGFALMEKARRDEALAHLEIARGLDPERPEVYAAIAEIFRMRGEVERAAEHYREALALRPDWPVVANNLAWMLATHPDRSLRDAEEAVLIAEALCDSSDPSNPTLLDTLAVSYAAAGRFDDAIRTAEQALDLARAGGDVALLRELEARRALFERGERLIESAPPPRGAKAVRGAPQAAPRSR